MSFWWFEQKPLSYHSINKIPSTRWVTFEILSAIEAYGWTKEIGKVHAMVSVASVSQKLLFTVDVQHRNQSCRKGARFFLGVVRRFGQVCAQQIEPAGPKDS